jgi:hypothetical protein
MCLHYCSFDCFPYFFLLRSRNFLYSPQHSFIRTKLRCIFCLFYFESALFHWILQQSPSEVSNISSSNIGPVFLQRIFLNFSESSFCIFLFDSYFFFFYSFVFFHFTSDSTMPFCRTSRKRIRSVVDLLQLHPPCMHQEFLS